jgi:hypothetical protein
VGVTLLASASLLYYLAVNGQSDGLVLLAAVLAAVAVQGGWFAAAAAGWAVAASLKVAPAVLGLHLARRRPVPVLAWGAAAALGVLLLPVPFWGPARTLDQHRAWLERVGARTPGDLPYPRNHSIAAFVERKLVEGPLGQSLDPRRVFAFGTTGLSLAVLALGAWTVLRAPDTPAGRGVSLAATLALAPPLTPVSWAATCVLLMPALLALQVTRTRPARADWLGEALLWGAALALNLVLSTGFQMWAPRLWAAFALLLALARRGEALRGAEAARAV